MSHVQTSAAARLPATVRLVLAPPDGELGNVRLSRFAAMLSDALAQRGVTVSPHSDYGLTVTLAERPGDLGVTQERLTGQGLNGKGPADWLSAPSGNRLLELCHRQITRISIVGQVAGATSPGLAAQGELDGCGNVEDRLGQLAWDLAARITQG